MTTDTLSAREYVARGYYKLLTVPGWSGYELGELEKAVLEYVAFVPVRRDLRIPVGHRAYREVHELIFEYLKANEPNKVAELVERNYNMLLRAKKKVTPDMKIHNPKRVELIKLLLESYQNLVSRNPEDIEFNELYGKLVSLDWGNNPFNRYANSIIQRLARKRLIASHGRGRLASISSQVDVTIDLSDH